MIMNKKLLWLIPLLLFISIITLIIKNTPNQQFYLEDKYYGKSDFTEIETEDLQKLIDNKESFALFIYQPACVTSANFEEVLKAFSNITNITIYKIAFSDIKDTNLSKYIKYYPSFAIFNKGSMVSYLDANSNDDLKYYKKENDFKKWFTKFVILKDTDNLSSNESNVTKENEEPKEETPTEINLENVTYDENKVNIYFFWGSTCPHCKAEFAFFDEIKEEYGNYYNLYAYEVWENENNAKIMNQFANALNEEVTGVPYTIIGDESFTGFGESSKEEFINAINNKHKNSSDVYFNKIKSSE